jgi:hypothetical protein
MGFVGWDGCGPVGAGGAGGRTLLVAIVVEVSVCACVAVVCVCAMVVITVCGDPDACILRLRSAKCAAMAEAAGLLRGLCSRYVSYHINRRC